MDSLEIINNRLELTRDQTRQFIAQVRQPEDLFNKKESDIGLDFSKSMGDIILASQNTPGKSTIIISATTTRSFKACVDATDIKGVCNGANLTIFSPTVSVGHNGEGIDVSSGPFLEATQKKIFWRKIIGETVPTIRQHETLLASKSSSNEPEARSGLLLWGWPAGITKVKNVALLKVLVSPTTAIVRNGQGSADVVSSMVVEDGNRVSLSTVNRYIYMPVVIANPKKERSAEQNSADFLSLINSKANDSLFMLTANVLVITEETLDKLVKAKGKDIANLNLPIYRNNPLLDGKMMTDNKTESESIQRKASGVVFLANQEGPVFSPEVDVERAKLNKRDDENGLTNSSSTNNEVLRQGKTPKTSLLGTASLAGLLIAGTLLSKKDQTVGDLADTLDSNIDKPQVSSYETDDYDYLSKYEEVDEIEDDEEEEDLTAEQLIFKLKYGRK